MQEYEDINELITYFYKSAKNSVVLVDFIDLDISMVLHVMEEMVCQYLLKLYHN
jgi:hypothetical protein